MELQSCSIAARGLWIELICLMHQAKPYGFLTINGKQIDDKTAAKLIGIERKKYQKLLQELIQKGVARLDETGLIYSRRMVEDENIRQVRRKVGLKGGNPAFKKGHRNPYYLDKQKDKQKITPSSSSSSSSSTSIQKIADTDKPVGKSVLKKRDEKTEAELMAEYQAAPNKKWNTILLAYHDRYGHLPTWAVSNGSVVEFKALAAALKKLNGNKAELFECFKLFLQDDEDWIVSNGHRPSLINKRLDVYLTRVRKRKKPHWVICRECEKPFDLKKHRQCPTCIEKAEKEIAAQGPEKLRKKEIKQLTGKLEEKFTMPQEAK